MATLNERAKSIRVKKSKKVVHVKTKIQQVKEVIAAYEIRLEIAKNSTMANSNDTFKSLNERIEVFKDILRDYIDIAYIGTPARLLNQQTDLFKQNERDIIGGKS